MFNSIVSILSAGLTLWNTKESRKYLERVIELKKAWHEEYNKKNPDDALLDNIFTELRIIGESFSAQVGKQDTKNK